MTPIEKAPLAVWAVTPNGRELAFRLAGAIPQCRAHLSAAIHGADDDAIRFDSLSEAVTAEFNRYRGHIFIMSAGIVVRVLSGLLVHKSSDPAVVVVDDVGRFAISLVSGHMGGANHLAGEVARFIGAQPVITTATDSSGLPAVDSIAVSAGLGIENPEAIKTVSMALLKGEPVHLYDGQGLLAETPFGTHPLVRRQECPPKDTADGLRAPGVIVDHRVKPLPPGILMLRPRQLAAGIGCNRGTPAAEIRQLLMETLAQHQLSPKSLKCLASVDIKKDEPGLTEVAREEALPLRFFSREELNTVENIETPSAMAEKHIGVKSVCEAAAILATDNGSLIVPKQRTRNVTVAIARTPFIS